MSQLNPVPHWPAHEGTSGTGVVVVPSNVVVVFAGLVVVVFGIVVVGGAVVVVFGIVVDVVVVVVVVDVVDVVVPGMQVLFTQLLPKSQSPHGISNPQPFWMVPHCALCSAQEVGSQQTPNLSAGCWRTQTPDAQLLLTWHFAPAGLPPA
jgi:hypothetical protein